MGPSDLCPLTMCYIVISAPLITRYVRRLDSDVLNYKAASLVVKYRQTYIRLCMGRRPGTFAGCGSATRLISHDVAASEVLCKKSSSHEHSLFCFCLLFVLYSRTCCHIRVFHLMSIRMFGQVII